MSIPYKGQTHVIGLNKVSKFDCIFFSKERAKYLPKFVNGTDNLHKAWDTILSYKNTDLVNFAKFVRLIMANFEFENKDRAEKAKDSDWFRIKRTKTSRTGRNLKLPARFQRN